MLLRLTILFLLASGAAAQAQLRAPNQSQNTGSTPASQMAARAAANANQVRDIGPNGTPSLSASMDDAPSDQPSGAQRIIRGQVNGTPGDPVLHYPYGRYGATLGNVDPNSLYNPLANPLANPLVRGTPNAPPAGTRGAPAFSRGR